MRGLVAPALALLICAALLFAAQHLSRSFDYHAVVKTLRRLPAEAVARAVLATIVSYVALIARDSAGLRAIGAKAPQPLVWIGAIVGSALGNAAGFGALTGSAVRYRVLAVGSISAAQVAQLTALTGTTFVLGLVAFSGLGMFCAAPAIGRILHVSTVPLIAGSAVVLVAIIALFAWCRPDRTQIGILGLSIIIPSRQSLLAQVALVGIDIFGAGLALYALFPAAHIGLVSFLTIYTIALLIGVIGHTPGGLGVFEAAILFALGGKAPHASVFAALLAYRAIYFLLPLLLSGALLAAFEVRTVAN